METFPLTWVFQADKEKTYATRSIVFESQKKQVQRAAVNPTITWKISCRGDNTQRQILESFHDRMAGNYGVFLFYDENDMQQQCRFVDAKLPIKLIREFSKTTLTHGVVVGFTCDLTIERAL